MKITLTCKNAKFEILKYPYGFRVYEETLGSRYRVSAFLNSLHEAVDKCEAWLETNDQNKIIKAIKEVIDDYEKDNSLIINDLKRIVKTYQA